MTLDDSHIFGRGEVYVVDDTVVRWLPDTSQVDKERYVLVLQNDRDSHDVAYPILIVAPITTKAWGRTKQDLWVEPGEGGLTERSLIKLCMIQPMLKTDVIRRKGQLKADTMRRVSALLAANLGMIDV